MMQNLFFFENDVYALCVHRPPVQLSVASATPSHSRPPCLGSGAVHSLLRCLSQSELHTDHLLQSLQLPSTERIRYKHKSWQTWASGMVGKHILRWNTWATCKVQKIKKKRYRKKTQKRRYRGEKNQLTWKECSLFQFKVDLVESSLRQELQYYLYKNIFLLMVPKCFAVLLIWSTKTLCLYHTPSSLFSTSKCSKCSPFSPR